MLIVDFLPLREFEVESQVKYSHRLMYTDARLGRREFLRVGGGLAISATTSFGNHVLADDSELNYRPARSCILVYLLGGPPHQDMFDLKPMAPAEIRGPFQPIATRLPGLHICELLPKLASLANRFTLIRSVTHRNSNHTPMIYYTLTGRHTALPERDNDIRPPQRDDFPHFGSVIAKFKPAPQSLPGFVSLPEVAIRSSTEGEFKRVRLPLRGGGAGFLGAGFESLAVNGTPDSTDAVPALALPRDVSLERFERRVAMLNLLDGQAPWSRDLVVKQLRSQAVTLTGATARGGVPAFSLESESERVRQRYGRHRFGQSMLMARRLAEAGVPMIAIHFNEMTVCDGWDTHAKNFDALKSELLPMLDQSLSALIEDLEQRDLLDQTVVACFGEFGRTPKINANAGRDHWGECSSTLLAGGPIQPGTVLGSSDKHAAFPTSDPVDPSDIMATLFHSLGLSPKRLIYDQLQRPFEISTGRVLHNILI